MTPVRRLLILLLVIVAAPSVGLAVASPSQAADPLAVTVTLALPDTSTYGASPAARVTVIAQGASGPVAVPGDQVTVQRLAASGRWVELGDGATGARGRVSIPVALTPGSQRIRVVAAATAPRSDGLAGGTRAGTSAVSRVQVAKARVVIGATDRRVVSERTVTLSIPLSSPTLPASALTGRRVWVRARVSGASAYGRASVVRTDDRAVARLRVSSWHGTTYRLTTASTSHVAAASKVVHLRTRGILARVTQAGVPHPRRRYPLGVAPVGSGANPVRRGVPDGVWRRMVGRSWHAGCPVGRAGLAYLRINYWGFDGYRHRGAIIVNRRIAASTSGAFRALYAQRFRIRLMQPEDVYGRNPRGPGANDYAAMRADDTSGFNCRYVVGKEARHVWSPHAYGIAIDLNDWENPYVAPTGVFPDRYYLHHRRGAGVLSPGSAAARAFTSRGFFWGARWNHPDLQHFERWSRSARARGIIPTPGG